MLLNSQPFILKIVYFTLLRTVAIIEIKATGKQPDAIRNMRGNTMERTFAMIKPDGVQRGLIGEIISRLEKRGIQIAALKLITISPELAQAHYSEHQGKPFFSDLLEFITSGPAVAMVLEAEGVIGVLRTMMGATDPKQAAPGTLRGDLALSVRHNVIHGSDSPASAEREIALFFPEIDQSI